MFRRCELASIWILNLIRFSLAPIRTLKFRFVFCMTNVWYVNLQYIMSGLLQFANVGVTSSETAIPILKSLFYNRWRYLGTENFFLKSSIHLKLFIVAYLICHGILKVFFYLTILSFKNKLNDIITTTAAGYDVAERLSLYNF